MATTKFMFPKQWEDWCSWGLGIWLSHLAMGAPFRFGVERYTPPP